MASLKMVLCLGILSSSSIVMKSVCTSDMNRFDCHPEPNADQKSCHARGCIWKSPSEQNKSGVPYCFYPKDYGYRVKDGQPLIDVTQNTFELKLERYATPAVYPDVFDKLKVVFITYKDHIRVKISPDEAADRYVVPLSLYENEKEDPATLSNELYEVEHTKAPFGFKIKRRESQTVIWDSTVAPMLFYDQYLQISTKLPSKYLYGFGEHEHKSYLHDMNWRTYGMFTLDQFPTPGANLYGHHPMYLAMEPDSAAHAVLLLNSNAMEVKLQPTPAVTFRTIGGILDFCIILGNSPEDVVRRYTRAVGRPFMPPYWSLGYQMSRWGYNSLDRVKQVLKRNSELDFPQDVQYGDIDYMDRHLDFTINKAKYNGLPEYVDELKRNGMRYIIILDPAISANETQNYPAYEDGVKHDVFIKNADGSTLYGKVWPYYPGTNITIHYDWDNQTKYYRAYAAFPDWLNSKAEVYWENVIKEFHEKLHFDGLWIDMNEPANFINGKIGGCPNNSLETPPYRPTLYGNSLAFKTLCMSSLSAVGKTHYNTHSLYGLMQSIATHKALNLLFNKRSLVITRSTYPGTGRYAGHWLGDNLSAWYQMHTSIIGMLEFGLFGIPYIGADICGFRDNADESLCRRWMQLGAFYPFCRNHNSFWATPQDPAHFGKKFALEAREVMKTRYLLLPYLYTLFYDAHTQGSTVVRPVMHEFPGDRRTWTIDKQFLWGSSVLINPVLEKEATSVCAYFPKARWYDLKNGTEIFKEQLIAGKDLCLPAPENHIPVFTRGGSIIPTQQPANNTMFSRKNNMGIVVSLDDEGKAVGKLFWDDGEASDSIPSKMLLVHITFDKNILYWNISSNGYGEARNLELNEISVYGICGESWESVALNGKKKSDITATYKKQVLRVKGIHHPISETAEMKFVMDYYAKTSCPYTLPDKDNGGAHVKLSLVFLTITSVLAWLVADCD